MRKPGRIWHRPVSRTYAYNLDLGENYYQPVRDFLDRKVRRARSLSPGALDFGERLVYCRPEGRRCGDYIQTRSARSSPFEESDSSPPTPIRAPASLPLTANIKGFPDKGFHLRQLEAAQAVAREEYKAKEVVERELALAKKVMYANSASCEGMNSQTFTTSLPDAYGGYGARGRSVEPLRYNDTIHPKTTHAHQGVLNTEVPSYNRYHAIKPNAKDDICKKVADIRMAPYKYGEAEPSPPLQSFQAKWSGVNQLEEDLATFFAYRASCAKVAALVAEEAAEDQRNTRKMKMNAMRIMV